MPVSTRSAFKKDHIILPLKTCLSVWVHLSDLRHVENQNLFEIIANEVYSELREQKWDILRPVIEKKNERAVRLFERMHEKSVLCSFNVSRKKMLYLMHYNYDWIQKIRFEDLRRHVEGVCDGIVSRTFLSTHFSLECPGDDDDAQYFIIVMSTATYGVSDLLTNALITYFCQGDQRISKKHVVEISPLGAMCYIPVAPLSTLSRDVHRVRTLKYMSPFLDMKTLPPKLYPNVKTAKKTKMPWFDRMWKTAVDVGEITLLWYCGMRERNLCFEQGVFSWRDPRFHPTLAGMKNATRIEILERIVEANRSDKEWEVIVDENVLVHFQEVVKTDKDHLYIDFEYIEDHVYLIGLWNASDKTHTALWDVDNNGTIWDRLNEYLQSLEQPYIVWYWYAEKNKCVSVAAPVDLTCWKDMCDAAKYMGMKGVFDFSLKSFVRSMYANGRLPFSYDDMECSDGGASIDLARRYFEDGDDEIRETLEKYNRCDCEAMWYVHQEIVKNIVYTRN